MGNPPDQPKHDQSTFQLQVATRLVSRTTPRLFAYANERVELRRCHIGDDHVIVLRVTQD